jgi:hypothetical protein
VYDALNLGNGYENVYIATPGSSGTVTDTLVTPFGNVNLDSLFGNVDAAVPMQPGDAFTGLTDTDTAVAKDAFTIGSYTFDPSSGPAPPRPRASPQHPKQSVLRRCWTSAAVR